MKTPKPPRTWPLPRPRPCRQAGGQADRQAGVISRDMVAAPGSEIYFRSCRHANLEPPDLARGILEFSVRALGHDSCPLGDSFYPKNYLTPSLGRDI